MTCEQGRASHTHGDSRVPEADGEADTRNRHVLPDPLQKGREQVRIEKLIRAAEIRNRAHGDRFHGGCPQRLAPSIGHCWRMAADTGASGTVAGRFSLRRSKMSR